MTAMHIYQRKINPDGADSLSRIALGVPAATELLDVGTGTGALGEFLTSQRHCLLDGVNYNADEIALARPYYRELLVANLEQTLLSHLFAGKHYDFIVFADVLEHLRNPAQILDDARQLLKPDGRIIISLPNIAYSGVIAELLAGQFNYTEEGILDQTHVRFFTRSSLYQLLRKCGFKPTRWDQISRQPGDSEFRHRYPDALPPALWQVLRSFPDALTYQFIVEAATEDAPVAEVAMPAQLAPEFGFMVQVYWSNLSGDFHEAESAKTLAQLGALEQTICLPLPATNLTQLRVDPADRPGTLKLWSLRIVDDNSETRWHWNGRPDGFSSASGLFAIANGFAEPGSTLALLDNDPNIIFRLENLELPPGCQLELKLSWPASNDSLALSHAYQQWTEAQNQLRQQQQQEFGAHQHALNAAQECVLAREQDICQLQTQLARAQEFVLAREQDIRQLQSELAQLQQNHHELQQQNSVLIGMLQAQQQANQVVVAENLALANELHQMKHSRSWRYTRFLRKE